VSMSVLVARLCRRACVRHLHRMCAQACLKLENMGYVQGNERTASGKHT